MKLYQIFKFVYNKCFNIVVISCSAVVLLCLKWFMFGNLIFLAKLLFYVDVLCRFLFFLIFVHTELCTIYRFLTVPYNLNIKEISLSSAHPPTSLELTPRPWVLWRAEGLWPVSSVLACMALHFCSTFSVVSSTDTHASCSFCREHLGEEGRQREKSYSNWL